MDISQTLAIRSIIKITLHFTIKIAYILLHGRPQTKTDTHQKEKIFIEPL